MKTCLFLYFRRGLFLLLLAADLCLGPLSHAAVGLAVSPSTISNTYPGPVTLQITGLTNGETVLLERFIDANTNAAVDSGEFLVQSFKVADGQVTAFGGVRDANVPGDDDGATNGEVRTSFSFNGGPEFSRGSGQHVFRLSSPTGRFAAVSQALNVTPSAYPQSVTGQVTSSGSPVTNALVALLVPVGNDVRFFQGAQSDGNGNFSLYAPPGDYLVVAARAGYVSDFGAAPMVTISSSQVVTQNLTLTAGTRSISGQVRDLASSAGIPGVQLFFQSSGGLFAFGFTDPTGNFNVSVGASQWEIDVSDSGVAQLGYLRLQNKPTPDTTAGNVTGVIIQLPKETALIYGNLKNETNAPLAGISFFGSDNLNQYEGSATTDTNGNYSIGVIAGNWNVGPDNQNPGLAGYLVQGTNVTVAAGQAVPANFIARRATAHLIGRVTDTSGNPISDIGINANNFAGGNNQVRTGSDGSFDLAVSGGTWHLQLETQDAAQRGLIGPELSIPVTDGVDVTNISYVVRSATAQITGSVKDGPGNPIGNVFVHANANVNGTNYNSSIQTDGAGNYALAVFNATWQVGVECFDLMSRGFGCVNEQSVTISGANVTVNFTVSPPAELALHFRHFANAGDFGAGITPSPAYPVAISSYVARLDVKNDSNFPAPDQVFFTGPAGSGLTGSAAVSSFPDTNSAVYFSRRVSSPATAPGGAWSVNYRSTTTSFSNVPDPQAAARLIVPLPTASVSAGTLQSLNWVYKDTNGVTLPAAPAFVTSVQAQVFDRDLNLIDNSPSAPPTTLSYTLVSPPPWSGIGRIRMIYVDTQTNAFFVNFDRASANLTGLSRPANNQFQFTVNGLAGQDYIVDYSTTLTNWTPLFTTNAPSSSFNILDPNATSPQRFYRVHSP